MSGLRYAHVARVAACAIAFLCTGCGTDSPDGPPTLVFNDDTASADFGMVEVTGLHRDALLALEEAQPSEAQWGRVLAVYTGTDQPADSTAFSVLGRYDVLKDRVRFTPRFPPAAGQSYYLRFDGRALPIPVTQIVVDTTVTIPRLHGNTPTRVVAVYPSVERVPMNLLRLYLHFSMPMSTGEAYKRVQVLDGAGQPVQDAFLVIAGEQELWDGEHRRLTLLFDPGRIKRDLRPHEELGLPLQDGKSYTLVVDSSWADANGNALASSYRQRFTVGPADRTLPKTADWRVSEPIAGTLDPITLSFPEPLDHALLERLLAVKTRDGRSIPGRATVGAQEMSWSFTPSSAWRLGDYSVEVGTDLEDLAGNNLRDVFDVDRNQPAAAGVTAQLVSVPFSVRKR